MKYGVNKSSVISFQIPTAGIVFRCLPKFKLERWNITDHHCQRGNLCWGSGRFRLLICIRFNLLCKVTLTITLHLWLVSVLTEVFDDVIGIDLVIDENKRCTEHLKQEKSNQYACSAVLHDGKEKTRTDIKSDIRYTVR